MVVILLEGPCSNMYHKGAIGELPSSNICICAVV
jgi:hypothetical protein